MRPVKSGRRTPRPVEKSREGSASWSPFVVQALCQRLPGGRMAVTSMCDVCRSTFYPCLCPPTGSSRLRAPRVVEEAETLRLGNRFMGTMRLVQHFAESRGMDKQRLLLLGATDPLVDDHIRKRYSFRKGNIVSRLGSEYVVELDGDDSWLQELELNPKELRELCAAVDTELTVVRGAGLKVVLVEYHGEDEAYGDLEVVFIPGFPASPSSGLSPRVSQKSSLMQQSNAWHVQDVRVRGPAYKAGVRAGHVLREMQRVELQPRREAVWREAPATEFLPGPFTMVVEALPDPNASDLSTRRTARSCQQPRQGASNNCRGLAWPVRFVFEALPYGWRAAAEGGSPLGSSRLLALARDGRSATVRFERRPYAVVSRSKLVVRHEHVWEHVLDSTQMGDVEMLREWGTTARMTHSQLSYAFRLITEALAAELREFDLVRADVEEQMIEKARACVELERSLDQGGFYVEQRRGIQQNLDRKRGEIRSMLEHVPLYFLMELGTACRRSQLEFRHAETLLPGSLDPAPDDGIAANQQQREVCSGQIAKTSQNLAKLLQRTTTSMRLGGDNTTSSGAASGGATTNPLEGDRSGTLGSNLADRACRESLAALGQEVDSFLERYRNGQEATVRDGRQETDMRDGRLSCKDFQWILLKAGICWLSEDEVRGKFNALDVDGSGYLTLGEVLKVAHRIEELMRLVHRFETDRRKAGELDLPQPELLEAFIAKLSTA